MDSRRGARLALQVVALVFLNGWTADRVSAQSALLPVAGAVGSTPRFALRPTFSLGVSILESDQSGDDAFKGFVFRGGIALGAFADLTVSGEHWPELGPRKGWALQGEANIYPVGRRRVAPYLLLHLGHFWATLPPGSIYTSEFSGRSTGFALGFHARVWDPLGVRLEGVIRYDAGGGDDQLRALVTYAPGLAQAGRVPAEVSAVVYGMTRASGPWHFVEPAYALKFATRMTQRDAAALTIALLHWQIPGQRSLVSYLWDTRAILLMPAWRRGKNDGNLRWYAQAGPSVSLMIEGPDEGFRGGANAELVGSVRLGTLPRLTGGIGWIWIVRGVSDSSVGGTDQRGLLFHAGMTF